MSPAARLSAVTPATSRATGMGMGLRAAATADEVEAEVREARVTASDTEAVELRSRHQTLRPQRRRGWLVRRALAAADVSALVGAFLVGQWLFAPNPAVLDPVSPSQETLLFLATLPGWLVVAKVHGLYDRDEERTDHSTADDLSGIFQMVTAGIWLFLVAAWLTDAAARRIAKLVFFWLAAIALPSLLGLLREHSAADILLMYKLR